MHGSICAEYTFRSLLFDREFRGYDARVVDPEAF